MEISEVGSFVWDAVASNGSDSDARGSKTGGAPLILRGPGCGPFGSPSLVAPPISAFPHLRRLGLSSTPRFCECPRHSCKAIRADESEEQRILAYRPVPVDTGEVDISIDIPAARKAVSNVLTKTQVRIVLEERKARRRLRKRVLRRMLKRKRDMEEAAGIARERMKQHSTKANAATGTMDIESKGDDDALSRGIGGGNAEKSHSPGAASKGSVDLVGKMFGSGSHRRDADKRASIGEELAAAGMLDSKVGISMTEGHGGTLTEEEELELFNGHDSSSEEDDSDDDSNSSDGSSSGGEDDLQMDHEDDEDIVFNLDMSRLESDPEVQEILQAESGLKAAHLAHLGRSLARNSHTVWALMRLG